MNHANPWRESGENQFYWFIMKLEISLVFVFRPKFLPISTWNSILTQTSKSMLRKLQLDIWNLTWIAVGREFENFVQIEHGYRIYFEFEIYRFWSFETMTPPIKYVKGRLVICLLCFDKDTNARWISENLELLLKNSFSQIFLSGSCWSELIIFKAPCSSLWCHLSRHSDHWTKPSNHVSVMT